MKIDSPTEADWDVFLQLARLEGWRVPLRELELYRRILADGTFVLRCRGETCGFATAVPHAETGWIGNLLVPAACRGRGYGKLLFGHALDFLKNRGMTSFWLTASESGRPLYEKKGFRVVGGIERWSLTLDEPPMGDPSGVKGDLESLCRVDCRIWGESRRPLLLSLAHGGNIFSQGDTTALLQGGNSMRVLGPWISETHCPRENRQVLLAALTSACAGTEVVVDLLEGSPLSPLLTAAGFLRRGRTDLMVLGQCAGVDLRSLVSLASLGSMG